MTSHQRLCEEFLRLPNVPVYVEFSTPQNRDKTNYNASIKTYASHMNIRQQQIRLLRKHLYFATSDHSFDFSFGHLTKGTLEGFVICVVKNTKMFSFMPNFGGSLTSFRIRCVLATRRAGAWRHRTTRRAGTIPAERHARRAIHFVIIRVTPALLYPPAIDFIK